MDRPKNVQVYTGRSIEEKFSQISPEVNIESFLCDTSEYTDAYVGVDQEVAFELATSIRNASVVIAPTDAVALSLESPPEHDNSVTRLVDLMLPTPDKIVVRSGLIEVFRLAMKDRNPGVLHLDSKQLQEAAAKSAIIYELGEFVSRKVYDRIALNFRTTANPIPRSDIEARGFFNSVLLDVSQRDVSDNIGEYEPSEEAKADYFRHTRPRRFSATGGWALLSRFDPLVSTKFFEESLRKYHFDRLSEGDILPPQDIGALYPLEVNEFNLLCEFIRGTDRVTPIDRYK